MNLKFKIVLIYLMRIAEKIRERNVLVLLLITQYVLYSVSDVNNSTRLWIDVYLLVRKGGGGSDWKL